VTKAVNPSIPVKSAIELLDTSNVVSVSIFEFNICPFLPSVSIPRAMSLSSNKGSEIFVTAEQS
jgi:hypothetical protein